MPSFWLTIDAFICLYFIWWFWRVGGLYRRGNHWQWPKHSAHARVHGLYIKCLQWDTIILKSHTPDEWLLLFYLACANETAFMFIFSTRLTSGSNAERDYCTVGSFSIGTGTIYADMVFLPITSFKTIISNVLCLIFRCLRKDSRRLGLQTISAGSTVSFPFFMESNLLTELVFILSVLLAMKRDVSLGLWKDVVSSRVIKDADRSLYKWYL